MLIDKMLESTLVEIGDETFPIESRFGVELPITVSGGSELAVFVGPSNRKITMPIDVAADIKNTAIHALENFAGYLTAIDRQSLELLVSENFYSDILTKPDRALQRARQFISAGVPPIFEKQFEGIDGVGRSYPILDEIILKGAGTYYKRISSIAGVKRLKNKAWAKNRMTDRRMYQPHCYASDVVLFYQRAFENGQLVPQFISDMIFQLKSKKIRSENLEEHNSNLMRGIKHLESSLRQFAPERREYAMKYEDGTNLNFLHKKHSWYLDYSPEDRIRIAEAYRKKAILTRQIMTSATYKRMKALFPGVFEGIEENLEQVRQELRISEFRRTYLSSTIEQKTLPTVIPEIIDDPTLEDLKRDYLVKVDKYFEMLTMENPKTLLMPMNRVLYSKLGMPQKVAYSPEVADLLHKHRLHIFEKMSDSEFMGRFPRICYVANFGTSKVDKDLPHASAVHNYVSARYRQLAHRKA